MLESLCLCRPGGIWRSIPLARSSCQASDTFTTYLLDSPYHDPGFLGLMQSAFRQTEIISLTADCTSETHCIGRGGIPAEAKLYKTASADAFILAAIAHERPAENLQPAHRVVLFTVTERRYSSGVYAGITWG